MGHYAENLRAVPWNLRRHSDRGIIRVGNLGALPAERDIWNAVRVGATIPLNCEILAKLLRVSVGAYVRRCRIRRLRTCRARVGSWRTVGLRHRRCPASGGRMSRRQQTQGGCRLWIGRANLNCHQSHRKSRASHKADSRKDKPAKVAPGPDPGDNRTRKRNDNEDCKQFLSQRIRRPDPEPGSE